MISRRGLFRLLGGLAASPVLKPLAGLIPVSGKIPGEQSFRCGSGALGAFYSDKFLDLLKRQTPMMALCQPKMFPQNLGSKTITFFRYNPEIT